jgi:hypothetical protein
MARDVDTRAPAPTGYRHWQSLSDGFLVSLAVVAPTFLFEELWRGRPMIDQAGVLWLLPASLMAIGFFAGGRVAGRNRRNRVGAFNQGLLVSGLTLVMIFMADMIRRVVLSQGLSWGVMLLWAGSAAGALLVGGLGGINGRRGTRLARKRHQMERFH